MIFEDLDVRLPFIFFLCTSIDHCFVDTEDEKGLLSDLHEFQCSNVWQWVRLNLDKGIAWTVHVDLVDG